MLDTCARLTAWFRTAAPLDEALAPEADALLDRFGGDVLAATRWCNDAMRRAEAQARPGDALRALALRRALGRAWAARLARPSAATAPEPFAGPRPIRSATFVA